MDQQIEVSSPITVFYSYAHSDELLRNELEKHLSSLRRQGLIEEWNDRKILPGTEWASTIDVHLTSASIILLLISPDFLASDYCYSVEMQRALERHSAGDACVIPIILRPVDWQGEPLRRLQCLPHDARPVTLWSNQDEAFRDIARGIRNTIERLFLSSGSTRQASPLPFEAMTIPSPANRKSPFLFYETINSDEALKLFRYFMDTSSHIRLLRLLGDAKLGKSHLLTKVFPLIAHQEYHTCYAILDLRNQRHTIADILNLTSSQLDGKNCSYYQTAYQTWNTQSIGQMESLLMRLSAKKGSNDINNRDWYLTTQFVKDLETFRDQPLLLLIDSVNHATESIQMWLMDTFLVQVSRLQHIRVVIAGRSIPEANGAYAAHCLNFQLRPVTEEDAYITYCHKLHVSLVEQSIRDIARLFDYRPGMFVDYVLPIFGD